MKKIILAATLVFGGSQFTNFVPELSLDASAKAYEMKTSFAKDLKAGTMPYAKGFVGMTYKKLKTKAKIQKIDSYNGQIYYSHERAKDDWDNYIFKKTNFSSNSKIISIERSYDYIISQKSVEKYFGKPYKKQDFGGGFIRAMYKNGKYYIIVAPYSEDGITATYVTIGTKKAVLKRW